MVASRRKLAEARDFVGIAERTLGRAPLGIQRRDDSEISCAESRQQIVRLRAKFGIDVRFVERRGLGDMPVRVDNFEPCYRHCRFSRLWSLRCAAVNARW